MDLLKRGSSLLLSEQCFDEYLVKFNFFDGECFKSTLSKCLGVGLILGSLLVKLPQIVKILRNRSGDGISMLSVSFDVTAIMIYACYSIVNAFPFNAWGDTAFLLLQTLAIGVLVLHFAGRTALGVLYAAGYALLFVVFISDAMPKHVLWSLQACNIPILVFGKLSQAYTNWRNGHTGQLAAATIFMLFAGSSARIFTSIQETGDPMSILTFVFATCANGVLVLQMIYYWNAQLPQAKAKKAD